MAVGTDGAIYVADWYDPGVGGHRMKDPESAGTIYRIAPKGFKPSNPKSRLGTTAGRIAALSSPAVNVRFPGLEALVKYRNIAALKELWNSDKELSVRARAVWALARVGEIKFVRGILEDDDPQVRILALRALERIGTKVLDLAREVSGDSSAAVRRELLLMLRDVPYGDKKDLLVRLAGSYDGKDRWYLEAFGIACENHEKDIYPLLKQKYGNSDSIAWDGRFAGLA